MSNKLNELKGATAEKVPEIMELKFGCRYRVKNRPQEFTIRTDYEVDTVKSLDITAIGRPIRLADVLIAVDMYSFSVTGAKGYFLVRGEMVRGNAAWDLRNDDLEKQSEETIDFLHSILCK